MSGQFDTEFERVKRSCADLASQMQCPHHFTNAKVEMTGESFDDFSLEVITCCEEFRKHVEEALDALVHTEFHDKGEMKRHYRFGRSADGCVRT